MNYVSLIFPPRDNRGQNNEQSECFAPPTDIYTHGSGLTYKTNCCDIHITEILLHKHKKRRKASLLFRHKDSFS